MPRTGYKSDGHVSIELDDWQTFEPGDVVTGTVVNDGRIPGGIASVTLRLVGRVKFKLVVKQNHGSLIYRNRFNLFDEVDSTWTLFDKANNGAATAKTWKFQAQIPTQVSPSAAAASKEANSCNPPANFFPVDGEAKLGPGIPDVFHYTKGGFSCFVEYYLEAEVKGPKASADSFKATVPLLVYSPPSQQALTARADYKLLAQSKKISIHTTVPKPPVDKTQQSLVQRLKASLTKTERQESAWKLWVACPRRLQLESPIPVVIWAEPLSPDAPPVRLVLQYLRLTIKSTTTAIFPGRFKARTMKVNHKYNVDIPVWQPTKEVQDVYIPTEEGAEPVDAGKAVGLFLYDDDIKFSGVERFKRFTPKLSPDLTTYCIKRAHEMTWVVCAEEQGSGKSHIAQVTLPVEIEGPSRQTMDQAIADLTEEEKRARFKALVKGAGLGWEGVSSVIDMVQAFS